MGHISRRVVRIVVGVVIRVRGQKRVDSNGINTHEKDFSDPSLGSPF